MDVDSDPDFTAAVEASKLLHKAKSDSDLELGIALSRSSAHKAAEQTSVFSDSEVFEELKLAPVNGSTSNKNNACALMVACYLMGKKQNPNVVGLEFYENDVSQARLKLIQSLCLTKASYVLPDDDVFKAIENWSAKNQMISGDLYWNVLANATQTNITMHMSSPGSVLSVSKKTFRCRHSTPDNADVLLHNKHFTVLLPR